VTPRDNRYLKYELLATSAIVAIASLAGLIGGHA
jgi:hypothetical protein